MPDAPAFFTLIENALTRWRALREEARTRRIVAGLPRHIRKDIGWPDHLPDRRGGRRGPWP